VNPGRDGVLPEKRLLVLAAAKAVLVCAKNLVWFLRAADCEGGLVRATKGGLELDFFAIKNKFFPMAETSGFGKGAGRDD